MSVQELEAAVLDLSRDDLARFARWFDAHRDDLWDRGGRARDRGGRRAFASVTHRATAAFWRRLERLPEAVQQVARKNHRLLEGDPRHPSLHLKKLPGTVPLLWSVRVGRDHRALAVEKGGTLFWFWIGPHDEYDRIVA